MPDKKILTTALTGLFLTAGQTIYIIANGDAACLNAGCAVVENLIAAPPLLFNILGILYFLTVAISMLLATKQPFFDWLVTILLMGGMITEGSLLAFQSVVAGAFCSYCLAVCLLIILMNLFRGKRHFATGMAMALLQAGMFVMLQPADRSFRPDSGDLSLTSGTYAVKTCSHTSRRLFLIFSEKCPHCQNVLVSLRGCSKCEVHFNPVARTESEILPGLEKITDFNPAINRRALRILGIDEIPVLVAQNPDGYRFIRGEKNIIDYIKKECSGVEDPFSPTGGIDFLTPADGFSNQGCSMEKECDEDNQQR
jgi:uncharacterized membrane protein